jgi:hypothetical protein
MDQEPQRAEAAIEVHGQVASLLHYPCPGRVRVHPGHRQTVADERHAINTIAEAPTNPAQRRTSNQNMPLGT